MLADKLLDAMDNPSEVHANPKLRRCISTIDTEKVQIYGVQKMRCVFTGKVFSFIFLDVEKGQMRCAALRQRDIFD